MIFSHMSSILFRNTRFSYHVFISLVALTLILFLCASNVYSAQATLYWNPNSESDLAGYKVYYGNSSRTYHTNIDVHKVTTYTITDLSEGEIYYFAATAYDKRKNESGYSNEVSYDVPITSLSGDTTPPAIISVSANSSEQVVVVFSEPVEEASATTVRNYGINNGIKDYGASLGSDQKTVTLTTSSHSDGTTYTLTVNNIEDLEIIPNVIAVNTTVSYNYVNQLQITNLNVASGKAYGIIYNGLQNGAMVYIDRKYKYSAVPAELNGATYIKTANGDNKSKVSSFLTFEVNQDVTVYVAYDDRNTMIPSWLSSFADTDDDIVISGNTFSIFSSYYSAGTITLGSNEGGKRACMYTVIIAEE